MVAVFSRMTHMLRAGQTQASLLPSPTLALAAADDSKLQTADEIKIGWHHNHTRQPPAITTTSLTSSSNC